jgi:L-asparaginase II
MTIINDVNPVVAEVVRSGFTESRHRGAVAGLAADGTQVISAGDRAPAYRPRRCGAPLFALTLTGLARAFRALVLAPPGYDGLAPPG